MSKSPHDAAVDSTTFRIIERLAAAERERGYAARTGLVMVSFFVEVEGRTESEVISLDATRDGRRGEVQRLPGESLEQLERRANPSGSWRSFPMPNFSDETRAMTAAEWDESVRLASASDRNERRVATSLRTASRR